MRINKYLSLASGVSRRQADKLIVEGRVSIGNLIATTGQQVEDSSRVFLDGKILTIPKNFTTIIFNKPEGYIVSRNGQGGRTIYELLPDKYQTLKPVGRLDKDSCGLLLLTNDGLKAQELTHPSNNKIKIYEIKLDKPINHTDQTKIKETGVLLEDGVSKLGLKQLNKNSLEFRITMSEGRNRQIRRTFNALGYKVKYLKRTDFGEYSLKSLKEGSFQLT